MAGEGKAKIKSSSQEFDFQSEKIFVFRYKKRFPKRETIRRARNALSSREWSEDYRYHILRNNCEHFARYCTTGERISIQAALFKILLSHRLSKKYILKKFRKTKNDELYLCELLKEYNLICDNCFRLSLDLDTVSTMTIMNEEDVNTGDVIRYKLHDAVILKVHRRSNSWVVCTIMHCAFRKGRKKGRIKRNIITIDLNGEYQKLDYTSKFNVYTPDVVVRRAKIRENEQLHVRDFNESRCFARWCKIKEPMSKKDTVWLDINLCAVL